MAERVCIVTGASRGIGRATALRFAKQGYALVATARNEGPLRETAEEIRAAGVQCEPVVGDVGCVRGAANVIETTVQRFGRIDVVVNNAGAAILKSTEDLLPDEFDQMMAVNCTAVWHMSRGAWPYMKSRGGGVIINVSSVSSVDPFPGFAVYGATKAWVNVFTKALAGEGETIGIRTYAVAPGAVETAMLRGIFPDLPAADALDPDQVAAVVEACADPKTKHASGDTIFIRKD